ncbi:MAG: hypothetical protein QG637_1588, partial [Chloroflexota bacterium]|nr:hypothetical protein [Chloroflexota bacterium]
AMLDEQLHDRFSAVGECSAERGDLQHGEAIDVRIAPWHNRNRVRIHPLAQELLGGPGLAANSRDQQEPWSMQRDHLRVCGRNRGDACRVVALIRTATP